MSRARRLASPVAVLVLVFAACSDDGRLTVANDGWLNPDTSHLVELDVLRTDVAGSTRSEIDSFGRGPNRDPYESTPQYASVSFTNESTEEEPLLARVVASVTNVEHVIILGCSMTYQGQRLAVHGETATTAERDAEILIYVEDATNLEDPLTATTVALNVRFRDAGEQAGEVEQGQCPDWIDQPPRVG